MAEDKKHEIWLKCMQMPNCSRSEASLLVAMANSHLN